MQCLGRLYLHPCASLATMYGHTTSQRRAKQVSLRMILGANSKGQGVSTALKKHSALALHVTHAIRAPITPSPLLVDPGLIIFLP